MFWKLLKKYDLDEDIWTEVAFYYNWYHDGNFHKNLRRWGIEDTRSYLRAYVEWLRHKHEQPAR